MRKRRCFCPRRKVLVSFVTTAFVRRRNTLPRSLIFLLVFVVSLAGFLLDADDVDDVDGVGDAVSLFVPDWRPLSLDFGFSALFGFALAITTVDDATPNDERVRRTAAFAVSTLRLFLKAKFVPTELMVVLLVDTTLKPRELPFAFCLSRIFLRFGKSFLFLLFGFGVKLGNI